MPRFGLRSSHLWNSVAGREFGRRPALGSLQLQYKKRGEHRPAPDRISVENRSICKQIKIMKHRTTSKAEKHSFSERSERVLLSAAAISSILGMLEQKGRSLKHEVCLRQMLPVRISPLGWMMVFIAMCD